MKTLVALLGLGIAFPCDAAPAPVVQDVAMEVNLAPKKVHEECARIEAGQSRRWYWKSNGPVDFNIHYHRGDEVFYPVKRDGMRGDGGTFTAKTGEDYCWMWTARDTPVRLEGRIQK